MFNSTKSINVETKKGNPVENFQGDVITDLLKKVGEDLLKKYKNNPKFRVRTGISPLYNCHGLVFASKRCFIEKDQEIFKILNEDNYMEISPSEVLPGDIAIYFNGTDIEHSAMVLEIDPDFNNHIVYGKWGNFNELIHRVYDCEYEKNPLKYFRFIDDFS